jgi:hypothetical protein
MDANQIIDEANATLEAMNLFYDGLFDDQRKYLFSTHEAAIAFDKGREARADAKEMLSAALAKCKGKKAGAVKAALNALRCWQRFVYLELIANCEDEADVDVRRVWQSKVNATLEAKKWGPDGKRLWKF